MKQKTRDTLDILNKRTGDDPELRQMIEEETLHTKISRLIYDARQHAGLTQQGLAELVGTTQSVVVKVFKYYLPVPVFFLRLQIQALWYFPECGTTRFFLQIRHNRSGPAGFSETNG